MARPDDEWRKKRMADLSKHIGGNAELGRKLGYKDGAYVRQMIAGERAITEKTIAKAEALPGCAGWFVRSGARSATPPAPPPRFEDSRLLTPEQWEQWQAFSIVASPEEKKAIIDRYAALKAVVSQEVLDRIRKGEKP